MLTTPDLLAFAGVAQVRVPALPLETQIAEKLHAYTRTYESGRPSSRTKDLVDIFLIVQLAASTQQPSPVRSRHRSPPAIPTRFRGSSRDLWRTGAHPSASSPPRSG
ncbi:MAG: nucleotidyl transferase AbiEii/AbiGii toxin family protein [Pseudonocardia sp.]